MAEQWWIDFFDDAFADQYLARHHPSQIRDVIDFLTRTMKLAAGDIVFDQCCGIGNISAALAEEGFKTIGVDVVPSYIERAKKNAKENKLKCKFFEKDARAFITDVPCDAAFNWWTSFGYFENDADNQKLLDCANLSLKKGGIFILDCMNREERLAPFKQNLTVISKTQDGYWESIYDKDRNMLVRNWVRVLPNGKVIEKKGNGAKLYSKDDIAKLLKNSGFSDISFYGSIAGEPVTSSSPRCIAVAVKTKSVKAAK